MTLEEYFAIYPDSPYKSYLGFNEKKSKKRHIIEGMLLFNEDTAPLWGGPFPGNFAYFDLTEYSDLSIYKHLTTEEKQIAKFIASYNKHSKRMLNESHENYEALILHAKNEYPTLDKPFRLRIAGNDDTSYSKNFCSKEEGLEFILLLESVQPLDMHKDIQTLFAFTN